MVSKPDKDRERIHWQTSVIPHLKNVSPITGNNFDVFSCGNVKKMSELQKVFKVPASHHHVASSITKSTILISHSLDVTCFNFTMFSSTSHSLSLISSDFHIFSSSHSCNIIRIITNHTCQPHIFSTSHFLNRTFFLREMNELVRNTFV